MHHRVGFHSGSQAGSGSSHCSWGCAPNLLSSIFVSMGMGPAIPLIHQFIYAGSKCWISTCHKVISYILIDKCVDSWYCVTYHPKPNGLRQSSFTNICIHFLVLPCNMTWMLSTTDLFQMLPYFLVVTWCPLTYRHIPIVRSSSCTSVANFPLLMGH